MRVWLENAYSRPFWWLFGGKIETNGNFCSFIRLGMQQLRIDVLRTKQRKNWFYGLVSRSKQHLKSQLEMWANAERDGRPAEYRWHPLFNAAKYG